MCTQAPPANAAGLTLLQQSCCVALGFAAAADLALVAPPPLLGADSPQDCQETTYMIAIHLVQFGEQLLCLTARGQVIAQDTGTGEELWRTHPRGPKPIRVASGPVMVVNGNLYAVSPRNTVFAVDTNPSPSGRDH